MNASSHLTKLFLCVTYVAGISVFVTSVGQLEFNEPGLFLLLCILASLAQILKVKSSTDHVYHTLSFLVYGFTFALLGTSEAILVIVASSLVEWMWNRPAKYFLFFHAATNVLGIQAAGMLDYRVNPTSLAGSGQNTLGILLGLAAFNLFNHLMVGIILYLKRDENFKTSGVFDILPLMLDLSLLYFGAGLSFLWKYNPSVLLLLVLPTYFLYSTLRVPALVRKTVIDSKTGLFNHQYFKKQLEGELARSNRFGRPLSVIIADLDLLRNINNTYGHLAGDEVLIGIARVMKQAVREYDVISRFGGEEFAILLPETTLAQAYEKAEHFRRIIETMEFVVPTSITPIRVTMSFGVAQREHKGQTSNEIVHHADLALYNSKLSGRNRTFALTNNKYIDFQATQEERDSVQNRSNPGSFTVFTLW